MVHKNNILSVLFLVGTLFVPCIASESELDIFDAINTCNKKQVKLWSIANKDVNQLNQSGQSALIVAVIKGNVKMVKEILKSGIDFNIVDKFNKTALDWAVSYGNYKIISPLIIAGGKVVRQASMAAIKEIFSKRARRRGIAFCVSLLFLIPCFFAECPIALVLSSCAVSLSSSFYNIICLRADAEVAFNKANQDHFFSCLLLEPLG